MDGFMSSTSSRMLRRRTAPVASLRAWAIFGLVGAAIAVPVPRANADVAKHDAEAGAPHALSAGAMRVPAAIPHFRDPAPAIAATEPKITVYRADAPQNFAIALRLKPASDEAESDLVLRLRSPRDYYVVRLNARGRKATFARVSAGKSNEIASVDCPIAADAWHTLQVRAEGNRFTVSLDGAWLFTAYDSVLSRPGPLAVWVNPGSPVQFDKIAVTPIGPE
jgi:hypothetical protein